MPHEYCGVNTPNGHKVFLTYAHANEYFVNNRHLWPKEYQTLYITERQFYA